MLRGVKVTSELTQTPTSADYNGNGQDNVFEKRFLVTFTADETHSVNVGIQPELVCDAVTSCTEEGCQPWTSIPFLYRYAQSPAITIANLDTGVALTATYFTFNTGAQASVMNVKLAPKSQPQLPPGFNVDAGVTAASPNRYDIRVLVATAKHTATSDPVWYSRVVFGHDNITTDGLLSREITGVFHNMVPTNSEEFFPTLNGFVYRGAVPDTTNEPVALPGAPGVWLDFPAAAPAVTAGSVVFSEILVKLPHCSVQRLVAGPEFKDVASEAIDAVDANVENVECSNRGQCNRATGQCECFDGFYGLACHKQTALV